MKAVMVRDKGAIWACCGHCGHKLAKVIGRIPTDEQFEIKCSSCKQLNIIQVKDERKDER